MIGYKILTANFTSVREKGRVNYLPDPSHLPGPWTEVGGMGAFISMDGDGLYCGGVPKNWACVRMEVENERPDPNIRGVLCWGRVRVIEILAEFPAAAMVGEVVLAEKGAIVNLPQAIMVEDVWAISGGATVNLPVATTVGDVWAIGRGATVNLPVATTVGDVWTDRGATVNAPVAITVGDVWAEKGATVNLG